MDEGSGPALLLLHGSPTWSFLYRHLIAGLRDDFRCVAPDYPGFGLSIPAPGYGFRAADHVAVIEGLIEALDLRDITLMVQDWGGPIGMTVAARHPERFRGFVIGNSWAWPLSDDRGVRWYARLLGGGITGDLLTRHLDVYGRVFLPKGVQRRKLPPEVLAMYRNAHPTPAARRPVQILAREILDARPLLEEAEQGLAGFADRPALIVWADRDPAFKKTALRRWQGAFPQHRTVMLEGASHYLQEDAPDDVVAAIRGWWPGGPAGTADGG